MDLLVSRGTAVIGPDQGEQACGDVGPGRMVEPEDIVEQLAESVAKPIFAGKKIVITAGPTQEHIDPVRYITNYSSGKMGYALARAATQMGAEVVLVSGPVNIPSPVVTKLKKVTTANTMYDAVMEEISNADIFIGCAAVADYRPTEAVDHKIKKSNIELTLTFVRNRDILASVAALDDGPFTVGFAAETQNVSEYAKDKLNRKKLDMIAANDVSRQDIGFNSDNNSLQVIWSEGEKILEKADKQTLAVELLNLISEQYNNA